MEGRVCDRAAALCLEVLEGGEGRDWGVARGEGLSGHCWHMVRAERRNINRASPTTARRVTLVSDRALRPIRLYCSRKHRHRVTLHATLTLLPR